MATSTKSDSEKFPAIHFEGPDGQEFESFHDLAVGYLEKYQPRWRESGCILPPVFTRKYRYYASSGENLSEYEGKISLPEKAETLASDRIADDAAYVVFKAIQQLIQDGIQAPFICVHGLDFRLLMDRSNILQGLLPRIFPHVSWDSFLSERGETAERTVSTLEYNFVLFGPKIGLIVLQRVNSFRLETYAKFFPLDHIASRFVDLLVQITRTRDSPSIPLTKFYFTQPPLYSTIRNLLNANSLSIPDEIYHAYGSNLCGIASLRMKGRNVVHLDEKWFSSDKATEIESESLRKYTEPTFASSKMYLAVRTTEETDELAGDSDKESGYSFDSSFAGSTSQSEYSSAYYSRSGSVSNTTWTTVPSDTVKLIGIEDSQMDSLTELGVNCLDRHYPLWRTGQHQVVLIPPILHYRNPAVSDVAVAALLKKKGHYPHSVLADRISDHADNMLLVALPELVRANNLGPLIAFRAVQFVGETFKGASFNDLFPTFNLEDFQTKLTACFEAIVPGQVKRKSAVEFDLILIGPRIGIVVVEVKSTSSLGRSLGRLYRNVVGHVNSIDACLEILEHATGIERPSNNAIRKILFCPNLRKHVYNKWLSEVRTQDTSFEISKNIIQWFRDDLDGEGGIDTLLHDFLLQSGTEISPECYVGYAGTIAAIATMTAEKQKNILLVKLDTMKISAVDALMKADECLRTQDPFAMSRELKRRSVALNFSKIVDLSDEHLNPILKKTFELLWIAHITPSQLKAITCNDNFQFIFGAAGTGKTIILQAKALEMLIKGETVFIVTNDQSWRMDWKKLFESVAISFTGIYGRLEEYSEYIGFQALADVSDRKHIDHLIAHVEGDFAENEECKTFHCSKRNVPLLLRTVRSILKQLTTDPFHIFIDADSLGHDNVYLQTCVICFLMSVIQRSDQVSRMKIWMAIDPLQIAAVNTLLTAMNKVQRVKRNGLECWITFALDRLQGKSVTILREAMRCSEEVFEYAYRPQRVHLPKDSFCGLSSLDLMPTMEHKIHGISSRILAPRDAFSSFNDALAYFCSNLYEITQIMGLMATSFAVIYNSNDMIEFSSQFEPQLIDYLVARFVAHRVYFKKRSVASNPASLDSAIITVGSVLDASSLEWPFVVYVCIDCDSESKRFSDDQLNASAYLAATHARTALLADFRLIVRESQSTACSVKATAQVDKEEKPPHLADEATTCEMRCESPNNPWKSERWFLESFGKMSPADGELHLEVKPMTSPVQKYRASYYHNCCMPKGHALAININCSLISRTLVDLTNITKVFSGLGYNVISRNCSTFGDVQQAINDFVDVMNNGDSSLVYVSACADAGEFLCEYRNKSISSFFEQIIDARRANEKPIIFIVQACRKPAIEELVTPSDQKMSTEYVRKIEDAEWTSQAIFLRSIPDAENVCVIHTTTPAAYSWPDNNSQERLGSCFTQAICSAFANNAHQPWADLSNLVTMANSKIHQTYENQKCLLLINCTMIGMKKKFHFFPGSKCPECIRRDTEPSSCVLH